MDRRGALDPQNRDLYTSGAFSPAGWAAFVLCLLAAAGLLVSAGLAYFRKQKELPVSPASVALLAIMGAMVAGCVFIATKPGPAGLLGVDLGFWAFGAGTVVGLLGAQMLAKELRPPDPDLLEGALTPDDFDEVTLTAPQNPKLPGGGGYPVTLLVRNNRTATVGVKECVTVSLASSTPLHAGTSTPPFTLNVCRPGCTRNCTEPVNGPYSFTTGISASRLSTIQ